MSFDHISQQNRATVLKRFAVIFLFYMQKQICKSKNSLYNEKCQTCPIWFILNLMLIGPYIISIFAKIRPTRWHLLYYILLNMFQTLIRPSSGASEYLLCCVGWLEACWCYVAGLSVGDLRKKNQQTFPLHNTSTPQVSLHNATSSR